MDVTTTSITAVKLSKRKLQEISKSSELNQLNISI